MGHAVGRFNTDKMVVIYRLPLRGAQQKINGNCPSSTCPDATQLSLSLYVSCTSQAAEPPLAPRMSICQQASLCAGPLRETSGFSGSFHLLWLARIPTDFYSHIFVGTPHPGTGTVSYGAPMWTRTPRSFRGSLCVHTLPPSAQPPRVSTGLVRFSSPPLLPVSVWLFLYIFRCISYDQLDFGWLSMLIVL